MNNLIKHIIESRYNFNIDLDNNGDLLSKSIHVQKSQYDAYVQPIVKAFENKNLDSLSNVMKKELYDNFEYFRKYQYKVKNKEEIIHIIRSNRSIKRYEDDFTPKSTTDLNWIDTSNITDMSDIFFETNFDGNISKWDVSNVKTLDTMFCSSMFNGDLSEWDVSNVQCMTRLFSSSKFKNNSLSNWNVSKVRNMTAMFYDTSFNGDISKWDVSNVELMSFMFERSKFNNDISNWDVSNVKDMECMFKTSKFNGDVSKWDVSNVTSISYMFAYSNFDGDISKWNISDKCAKKDVLLECPLEKRLLKYEL